MARHHQTWALKEVYCAILDWSEQLDVIMHAYWGAVKSTVDLHACCESCLRLRLILRSKPLKLVSNLLITNFTLAERFKRRKKHILSV